MSPDAAKFVLGLAILLFSFALSQPVKAQSAPGALSGIITDPSGKGVTGAKVSAKNVATAQAADTQTDASGHYNIPNLAPGDYELSVSAPGFSTNTAKFTLLAGAAKTLDMSLGGVLSLGELGFSQTQTQGSAQDQARLDKRSHMLQMHQRFGLIATAPLVATVIAGPFAGGKQKSSTDRWLHLALGSATGDLYGISAYYAIFAPKIQGTQTRGQIRLHKILAWIHGPGMIATPILGAMAFDQKSKGQHIHGVAQAHGPVAIVTAAAYGAAILSVSVKF